MPKDLREKIADAAEDVLDDVIGWIREIADTKHEYSVKCRYCGKDSRHPFPDGRVRIAAGQFLIDNGIGKPATQKAAPEKSGEKAKNLEDYSLEELLAIVGGEDGETDSGAAEEAAG